jgi:hypothetical protein
MQPRPSRGLERQRADQVQPRHPGAGQPGDRRAAGLGDRAGGAGGLAAALSTAAGLLLAISSAVSHDLLKGQLNPQHLGEERALCPRGSRWRRRSCGHLSRAQSPGLRGADRGAGLRSGGGVDLPGADDGHLLEAHQQHGAVAGMLSGLTVHAGLHLPAQGLVLHPGHQQLHRRRSAAGPVKSTSFGAIGALINFGRRLPGGSVTKETPQEIKDLVESVRVPRGPKRQMRGSVSDERDGLARSSQPTALIWIKLTGHNAPRLHDGSLGALWGPVRICGGSQWAPQTQGPRGTA